MDKKYIIPNTCVLISTSQEKTLLVDLITQQTYKLNFNINKYLYKDSSSYLQPAIKKQIQFLVDSNYLIYSDFPCVEELPKFHLTDLYASPKLSGLGFVSVSIQVTTKCKLDCSFCDDQINRQCGCNRYGQRATTLPIPYLLALVQVLSNLRVKTITLVGGDILEEYELLEAVATFCLSQGINLVITITGIQVTDRICKFFEKFHISLKIVRFVKEENIDTVVGVENYREQIDEGISKIKKYRIKYGYSFLSDTEFSKNQSLISNHEVNYLIDDTSRFNRGVLEEMSKGISLLNYELRSKFIPCLLGSFHITLDGNIIPCIPLVEHSIGTISKPSDIYDILRMNGEKLYRIAVKSTSCREGCVSNSICSGCLFLKKVLQCIPEEGPYGF